MSEPTNQTYQLKTYDDFMALTPEQFGRMLADFLTWRVTHETIIKQVKLVSEATGTPVSEIIQLPDCFEWIDDGVEGGLCHAVIQATKDSEPVAVFDMAIAPDGSVKSASFKEVQS